MKRLIAFYLVYPAWYLFVFCVAPYVTLEPQDTSDIQRAILVIVTVKLMVFYIMLWFEPKVQRSVHDFILGTHSKSNMKIPNVNHDNHEDS